MYSLDCFFFDREFHTINELINHIKKLNKKLGIKNTDDQFKELDLLQLQIVLANRSANYNYVLNNKINK